MDGEQADSYGAGRAGSGGVEQKKEKGLWT